MEIEITKDLKLNVRIECISRYCVYWDSSRIANAEELPAPILKKSAFYKPEGLDAVNARSPSYANFVGIGLNSSYKEKPNYFGYPCNNRL